MTSPQSNGEQKDASDLLHTISEYLGATSEQDVEEIKTAVLPALVIHAVNSINFTLLDKLKSFVSNVA